MEEVQATPVTGEQEGLKPPPPTKKKPKPEPENLVKTRCVIATKTDHPFSRFLGGLKERGVRGFDPGDFIKEALDSLPEDFWKKKLEDLTPLEFRINAALADPEMREKLSSLLASGTGH